MRLFLIFSVNFLILTSNAQVYKLNIVKDIIGDEKHFLNNLNQKIDLLKSNSHFKGIDFNYTDSSIYKIDNIIISTFLSGKLTKSDIKKMTESLIAYIGETYIKCYGGHWEVNSDKNKFMLFINKDGKKIDFITPTIETLIYFEEEELPSLGNGYFSIVKNPFFKH